MEKIVLDLKAIADTNRLKILSLLLNKQHCVKSLAKKLDISESSVSQHLKKLREAGFVIGEKKGYWVHYSAKNKKLINLSDNLKQLSVYMSSKNGHCCNEKE
ncbi:metalloregulator ArsR/SmtB family transcription factor [Natroniella acetigena]|uniref:ArsR/SmtB family transcription factor n=1 Tax=Natroniella acetigena TaxID=52004 RepID=UPI00200BA128|nr:metalloregulator ArsR/SmtB family transcription factor [Natroniella acetigena]MCK8828403.1 metalloregulator ArsR/SmtB family transcription factor [Natroniella acetigena]